MTPSPHGRRAGSLVFLEHVEWVDTGGGYHPGLSTWKVVRGTGQCPDRGGPGRRRECPLGLGRKWSARYEGLPNASVAEMRAETDRSRAARLDEAQGCCCSPETDPETDRIDHRMRQSSKT